MVSDTTDRHRTAFTQSVDLLEGTTTGVSASDRSKTVRALADDSKGIECFQRPGHVFPLVASEGGLKKRQGHTEAAVELCRLAGLKEVACLSEIALKNGEMVSYF
jgi:3,4-dihydroxy 2-butanone 4-phosphate synthase/GTP cyclohydrolase II